MVENIKDLVQDLKQVDLVLRDNIGLDVKETFGVEIEFENVNLDNIKRISKWTVKKDDSITKENVGGELVSPILTDTEDTWRQIDDKCKYLRSKNASATPKTASHIHIGSQILKDDPNNIRKFLKMWELFENIIFYFSYGKDIMARPTLKTYARPISEDLYKIRNSKISYNQYRTYYDWYHFFQKQRFDKHAALNFKNYKGYERDEKNTIEIRCPNGTLDERIWQNNINFFMKLMVRVTNSNFDEKLIDYLLTKKDLKEYGISGINLFDMEKAILLADIVFDKEIDKLLFLKQYFKLFDEEKVYTKNKNHSV